MVREMGLEPTYTNLKSIAALANSFFRFHRHCHFVHLGTFIDILVHPRLRQLVDVLLMLMLIQSLHSRRRITMGAPVFLDQFHYLVVECCLMSIFLCGDGVQHLRQVRMGLLEITSPSGVFADIRNLAKLVMIRGIICAKAH